MTVYATRLANSADTITRMRMTDLLDKPLGSAALMSQSGLRPDGGGVVAATAGSMNVTVSPLIGWVQGPTVAQGGYTLVSDATVTLAITAGHASLSRTDTVVAVVRDNAYDSSGQTAASVEVVTGTPGAGAPALPPACIPLRDIVVPAGTSAGTGGLTSGMLSTDRRNYLDSAVNTWDTQTADATYASAGTAGDMAGLSRVINVPTTSAVYYLSYTGAFSSGGGVISTVNLYVDSTLVGALQINPASGQMPIALQGRVTGLTPGNHTFKVRGQNDTGSSITYRFGTLRVEQRAR